MRAEEIKELIRRQPFVPMRLHMTDGMTYEIHHPDNVLVSRIRVDVGVGDSETGIADRVDFLSLLHIVRIEDIRLVSTTTNGHSS